MNTNLFFNPTLYVLLLPVINCLDPNRTQRYTYSLKYQINIHIFLKIYKLQQNTCTYIFLKPYIYWFMPASVYTLFYPYLVIVFFYTPIDCTYFPKFGRSFFLGHMYHKIFLGQISGYYVP